MGIKVELGKSFRVGINDFAQKGERERELVEKAIDFVSATDGRFSAQAEVPTGNIAEAMRGRLTGEDWEVFKSLVELEREARKFVSSDAP